MNLNTPTARNLSIDRILNAEVAGREGGRKRSNNNDEEEKRDSKRPLSVIPRSKEKRTLGGGKIQKD